jgi:hypothetical protein
MNTGVLMGSVASVAILFKSLLCHVIFARDQQRHELHLSSFYPLCLKQWLPGAAHKSQIPRDYPGKYCVLSIFLCGHRTFTGTSRELPLNPPLEPRERRTAYNLSRSTHNLCHIAGTTEHYLASPGAQDF